MTEAPLRNRFALTATALVFVNLLPLLGVLLLDWSVAPIMLLYWSENVVVGVFNIVKMIKARGTIPTTMNMTVNGRPVQESSRRGLIVFFLFHYGIFTFVHGVFVFVRFGTLGIRPRDFLIAFALLILSHGISYRRHFIGGGEYRRVSFTQLFWQPYKRVIIMHLTILLGGAWAQAKGSPPLALAFMVVLKTGIDLLSHYLEHRKLAKTVTT